MRYFISLLHFDRVQADCTHHITKRVAVQSSDWPMQSDYEKELDRQYPGQCLNIAEEWCKEIDKETFERLYK